MSDDAARAARRGPPLRIERVEQRGDVVAVHFARLPAERPPLAGQGLEGNHVLHAAE